MSFKQRQGAKMKKVIQITILAILMMTVIGAKTLEEKKEECWKYAKSPHCDEILMHKKSSFLESSQSCENGNPLACWRVGLTYANGTTQVKKDMDLARKYYTKSCELGNNRICVFVSMMFLRKALKEYKEWCDKGIQRGCEGVDFAKNQLGLFVLSK